MKKIYVNLLLACCTVGLAVACYMSIYSDIAFDEEKAAREKLLLLVSWTYEMRKSSTR